MERKYEFTDETKEVSGHILHRIAAVKDFGDVKKGEKGGFIEKEDNLSHEGNAWVSDNAVVYDNARVYGNACVYDNAWVYGNTWVYDNACVSDNAVVYGNAYVYGNAWVSDNAVVYGNAKVYDNVCVRDNAVVKRDSDYVFLRNKLYSGSNFTYTRSNRMWTNGLFYGTSEELIKNGYASSEKNGKCCEAAVKYVEEIYRIMEEHDK